MRVGVTAALCAAFAFAGSITTAQAREYAPLDRPGPPITVRASLNCTPDVAGAKVQPVLLNPATGVTVAQNYDWNYERALTARGIPWCAYDAPQHTLGDIQASGELLVDAIRRMHAMAGRRIAILGHSQGGMSFRWALRFWPDTRAMVDDTIGLAPSNHGTIVAPDCRLGCVPATWQQDDASQFVQALNSRAETFAGISYTNVYSLTDEVVQPNRSSQLTTGAGRITNMAIQSICPAEVVEHLTIGTTDPVAYALVIDALTHDGPAKPSRISRLVCLQGLQPGVDPLNPRNVTALAEAAPYLAAVAMVGVNLAGIPTVRTEPALRSYVFQ